MIETPPDPRVPRWLLIALVALIGVHMLDAAGTASTAPQYQALAVPFPASLRIALSLAWVLVLAVLVVSLIRRRALASRLAAPLLTADALVALIWQIAFARADYARGQLGFLALLSLIALVPVWWIALRRGWLRPRAERSETE